MGLTCIVHPRHRPRRVPWSAAPGAPTPTLLASSSPMFENLRRSLRDLLDTNAVPGGASPSLGQMRETLVQARVGLAEMRQGVEESRLALVAKQRELETVRRRKSQAEAISD